MAKRNKSTSGDKHISVSDDLAHRPFAAFADLVADMGSSGEHPGSESAPPPEAESSVRDFGDNEIESIRYAKKIVLRREKKGRGGKVVTVLEGIEGPETALFDWARQLAKSLGIRVHVEANDVILAGDQRLTAQRWLAERGVKNIVIGN